MDLLFVRFTLFLLPEQPQRAAYAARGAKRLVYIILMCVYVRSFCCEQGGGDMADGMSSLSSSSSLSLSRYLVAWAARLGWRNPSASAQLLECLAWAKTSLM